MERGIHFMGSGARHAMNFCDFTYRQKILRPEEYHRAYCLSLLGDIDIGLNQATKDAFKSLLIASLFDPSSGGPFKVHSMSNDKATFTHERQTFLKSSRTHYDSIKTIFVDSIFLPYPACLEDMDILTARRLKLYPLDRLEFSHLKKLELHPLDRLEFSHLKKLELHPLDRLEFSPLKKLGLYPPHKFEDS
ncbi:hypothetical protein D8674_033552 [Pyrus ussuriensis x Pyrus communis]|uniref:Uncharacterized protein n=1 Tax=Pyrus ussuriensis x Pyrus communis TaxID=2448454 RepID=A0A5N5HPN2_9ROSA|nr:hypothetical protein D8674_033552 [Pyrus ussuriensis x Pyrus communis]